MSVLENMTAWHSHHSILDLEHVPVPGAAWYTVGAKCVCFFSFSLSFLIKYTFPHGQDVPSVLSGKWKQSRSPPPGVEGMTVPGAPVRPVALFVLF